MRREPKHPEPKHRRTLTAARTGGRIDTAGDPRLAAGLARALGVGADQGRDYTHGFHTYPARMHPLTARRALALIEPRPRATVLDPFCGSGTVLVEAVLAGARAVGVDASPLAILIARAKLWAAPADRRRALVDRARELAARAIEEGKAARRSGYEPPPELIARGGRVGRENVERNARLSGWFAPHVRRELELLAAFIAAERDAELRDLLTAILSSVIVKMSRRASDTRGEKVERNLARGMAARLLADRAVELVRGLDALHHDAPPGTPPPELLLGDARSLPFTPGSVAAIVTSPPYAGTYDYLEQHSLRLDFFGLPPSNLAQHEIGARRSFAGRVEAALAQWDRDLQQALSQMARVLIPGASAAVLIGDSLAGRPPAARAVHAEDTITRLAGGAGLHVVARASAPRAPLGAAEAAAFAARPKREHLILLRHA